MHDSPRRPWTSPLWAEEYTLGSKVLVDEPVEIEPPDSAYVCLLYTSPSPRDS